jgi:mannose-1-phosphate guanylyltransferase / phosphomannomutase
MAGGEGTRLRPLTISQPKPMLPIANLPMAEHIITLLKKHGITEVVVTVAYLANTIRTYFGDGSEFGVSITYAAEETPLGTAGSVRNAKESLDETFLVISGDVLTDVDLTELIESHERRGAMATLALKAMDNPLEFGIVITDDEGRIERFLEKPNWGQVFSDTINTGIYVLEPEVLDYVKPGISVDFSSEVFPALLEAGAPIFGYITEGYWEDVGTLEAYLSAHLDVLEGRVDLDMGAFPLRPGVWIGEGAEIDPSAELEPPVMIGQNSIVGPGARVGPNTVLGSNVHIGDGSEVNHSVLHDNCYVGPSSNVRGSVVGRSCELGQGAHLESGVVLGDHTRVGSHAVITSDVRIYPHKFVEPDATITSSIIWETRGARSIFGGIGVSGLANIDLSPEFAMKVAMAYATMLPKGSIVTTSRDSSRSARMLKRAIMVGLTAAGMNVEDLEVATVPVTRFEVRTSPSQGGVSVRLAPGDPNTVMIRFLDAEGLDIDESTQRKIERLYFREGSRRVLAAEIGDIDFPARTVELYTSSLFADVDVTALRRTRYKLVLDYSFGAASLVMPNVLAKLSADVLVINPLVSTVGMLGFDRIVHAHRLAELVRSSGAHLGAVISADGEQLTLIDNTGRVLSDDELLLVLARLVAESVAGARIVVPVNATHRLAEVAEEYGAKVIWTKVAAQYLLNETGIEQGDFAGNAEGGFCFPSFMPALDAVSTLVHLLALLGARDVDLSELVVGLPSVHVVHERVATPFERKGVVMRKVVEAAKGDRLVLIDGVKTFDADGWTLIVPDPEAAVTHVYAEGTDDASSRQRVDQAARDIAAALADADSA